jgi:hypothetical protein
MVDEPQMESGRAERVIEQAADGERRASFARPREPR